jgi:hypothetical protein
LHGGGDGDALVLWGEVLVDGHNRYGICQQHGVPFQTVQNTRFKSMDDVHLWMIDQHLGRRSVSDFQRGVLALRKKEIIATQRAQAAADGALAEAPAAAESPVPPADPLNTREAIAKAARISSNTVVQIEKIQKSAAPELVEAVKQGTISINAAAAVASLPSEQQVAAVAGGKKELKEAAKRVRDAKASQRAPAAAAEPSDEGANQVSHEPPPWESDEQLAELRRALEAMTQENSALKQQVAQLQARLAELSSVAS